MDEVAMYEVTSTGRKTKPKPISGYNALLNYNRQPHRSELHSRLDGWLTYLPAAGFRAMCSWEQYCRFAREPERRKVGGDARVTGDGSVYEVDSRLAGETVVLLWGLFECPLFRWGSSFPGCCRKRFGGRQGLPDGCIYFSEVQVF